MDRFYQNEICRSTFVRPIHVDSDRTAQYWQLGIHMQLLKVQSLLNRPSELYRIHELCHINHLHHIHMKHLLHQRCSWNIHDNFQILLC